MLNKQWLLFLWFLNFFFFFGRVKTFTEEERHLLVSILVRASGE